MNYEVKVFLFYDNYLMNVLVLIMMVMIYVVKLLHANDCDIDGECMYAK